jgi:hypothetical protein
MDLKHAHLTKFNRIEVFTPKRLQGQSGYYLSNWWLEESRSDIPTNRRVWIWNVSPQPMVHPTFAWRSLGLLEADFLWLNQASYSHQIHDSGTTTEK